MQVQDSEIGLATEHQTSIFEIFSQVTPTMERSPGGLGIGLALSHGFTQLHRGDVVATREGADKGSTFVLSLPMSQQSNVGPT